MSHQGQELRRVAVGYSSVAFIAVTTSFHCCSVIGPCRIFDIFTDKERYPVVTDLVEIGMNIIPIVYPIFQDGVITESTIGFTINFLRGLWHSALILLRLGLHKPSSCRLYPGNSNSPTHFHQSRAEPKTSRSTKTDRNFFNMRRFLLFFRQTCKFLQMPVHKTVLIVFVIV